jgi:hypothetical protein
MLGFQMAPPRKSLADRKHDKPADVSLSASSLAMCSS